VEGLNLVVFKWGKKYGPEYVDRLKAGLERHLKQEFKFCVIAPQEEDEPLTKIPGCFARLRAFSPEWQERHGLSGRIVCIDLDVVITGSLDVLFDRPEPFVILSGANSSNPCPVNGSLWMLRSGYRPDVWSDFSIARSYEVKFDSFPDDQAWFWAKMPDFASWACGPKSGVYAFQKPQWPKGDALPADARLVAFPGWRDPFRFTHLDWVRKHWIC